MTEAPGSADAVQVRLGSLREVEVDDHIHGLDVDATCKEVG